MRQGALDRIRRTPVASLENRSREDVSPAAAARAAGRFRVANHAAVPTVLEVWISTHRSIIRRPVAIVCLLALPAAALAVRGPAEPDTLEGGTILDRINLHPSYSSAYKVNRTSRTWEQGLGMSRQVMGLNFKNNWSLTTRRDKAQSNLRGKRGSMRLSLDYALGGERGWTVGLDGNFKRDSQLSKLRDQVEDRSDVTLTTASKLPEQIMRRAISPLREFELTSGANFGYSDENNVSRRSTARDTTHVGGLLQHYDLGLSGAVAGVNLSVDMSTDRRSGESKTKHRSASGQLTQENDKTGNKSQHWQSELSWKPITSIETRTTGRWLHELNDYWDIQANNGNGGQESKDGRDVGANMKVEWKPNKDSVVHGELDNSMSQAVYELQSRDFEKRIRRAAFDGVTKLPSFSGPLTGTEMNALFKTEDTKNTLEGSASYDQQTRNLKGGIRRQLGSKVQVQFSQELWIVQYFYDDRSFDRDERRTTTDMGLSYNPSRWTGSLNYNQSERKTVNIPASKAANNNTTQTYKVGGELNYTVGRVSLGQRYTIQADYTFYDFDENKNTLVRTNGVMTNFGYRFGARIATTVAHEYQFRENGNYVRFDPAAPRSFNPSSQETRHMLTLTTSYSIGNVLRLQARQMFDRRENRPVAVKPRRVTTTDRGEFSARAELEQSFSDVFKVRASFQKTESITERDYWTVDASVQRIF